MSGGGARPLPPPGPDPAAIAHIDACGAVLAAVSGGADSVLALHVLADRSRRVGFPLAVCHVHHGVRGGADADAAFVRELCVRLGVLCRVVELVPGETDEGSLSAARHGVLQAVATETRAGAIALGHNLDDAAETFLLMALRGSGPMGLGLPPVTDPPGAVPLVRPLIGLRRAAVRETLRDWGEGWRDDPTNDMGSNRRAVLRRGVLPLMETMEPAAVELLARAGGLARGEALALRALALARAGALARCSGGVLLDAGALRELPVAARAAVLHQEWTDVAPPSRTPAHHGATIRDLAARLDVEAGHAAHFPPRHGVGAIVTNRHVMLHRDGRDPGETFLELSAMITGIVPLPEGRDSVPLLNSSQKATAGHYQVRVGERLIRARVMDIAGFESTFGSHPWGEDPFASARAAAFDPRALLKDLCLRAAAAGDSLGIGGGHSKPLADVLQEARLPARVRDRVGVVADGRGVLWVPGVRRGASALVTARTETVLVLSVEEQTAG